MKSILKYLLPGKKKFPPQKVIDSFRSQFGNSKNIEWEEVQLDFEAIFYYEDIEQIARFNAMGELISLKKNLTVHHLPEKIASIVTSYGEVMNVIEISKSDQRTFEIIYRDESLVRYTLLLDDAGAVISHKIL